MAYLQKMAAADSGHILLQTSESANIQAELARWGVIYAHYREGLAEATQAQMNDPLGRATAIQSGLRVVAGYKAELQQLSCDPADPHAMASIAKDREYFCREHTHSTDEAWYFLDGRTAFYLRLGDCVCALVCERGDFICIPHGTRHWFDAGGQPSFTGLRFFLSEAGFVGDFTGDPIALRFPRIEALVVSQAETAGKKSMDFCDWQGTRRPHSELCNDE